MKKYFMVPFLTLSVITISCSAQKTTASSIYNSKMQKNIAADNVFLKVLETGDTDKLDAVIAPDFFNHTGNHHGVDSLKISIRSFHAFMKTVKLEQRSRCVSGITIFGGSGQLRDLSCANLDREFLLAGLRDVLAIGDLAFDLDVGALGQRACVIDTPSPADDPVPGGL